MKQKLIMLCCSALMCCVACQEQTKETKTAPVRVRVEAVTSLSEVGQLSYVGVVEEGQATAVSFTSMGVLQKIYVSEGQTVTKGMQLARIDDSQARSMLQAATASNKQAEDAIARYKQLYDKGSISEANWVEAQSKVEQARSTYLIAQKQVSDCILKAPCSGVIGKKNMNVGETALPSQPIMTILNIDTVKVKIAVPEREMLLLTDSSQSIITIDALDGVSFAGCKIEKGVQADAMTHTYTVRIKIPNTDNRLLPGMVAKVAIKGASSQNLTVPISAVQQLSSGERFVWTMDSASVSHRTMVAVGPTVGNRIVIASGLKAGDTVIIDGFQKISEGSKVEGI
ncbi:MAG: efflux RND transporter periplasmic adaptor subunit [Bacteroidales bacterium]|nr:efflux RND transporter periplasmic adaptor subunit [Bacteroidales bacterium]